MQKIIDKINDKKEFIHSFKELKKTLIETSKYPFENSIFQYFDFISWVESKIENKSFTEIIKSKNHLI